MKKALSLLMAGLVALSICACGRNDNNRAARDLTPDTGQNIGNLGQTTGIDPTPLPGVSPVPMTSPGTGLTGLTTPDPNLTPGVGMNNGQGTVQGAPNTTLYRDGIFTGEADRRGDTMERAVVTITNGRITDILLRRFDNDGRELTDETVNPANTATGGVTANLGQTRRDLVNAMMMAQTNDVKTSTTGDTEIVQGWKTAVGRALEKARR